MLNFAIMIADNDPLSGGAGWVGAGLLGAVLAWLMFVHLPAKDKQFEKLTTSNQERCDAQDKAHDVRVVAKDSFYAEMLRQQRSDYKSSLDTVVEHCKTETTHMSTMLTNEFKELRNAIDGLSACQVTK